VILENLCDVGCVQNVSEVKAFVVGMYVEVFEKMEVDVVVLEYSSSLVVEACEELSMLALQVPYEQYPLD